MKIGLLARLLVVAFTVSSLGACATKARTAGLGIAVATAVGAQAPTNEMETIYYLGVFDPQDQIPPTVYRVRVHGQASFLSQTKFASGWVRAELVDSLSTGGHIEANGVTLDTVNTLNPAGLSTKRRFVMFGPEGFREAPRDHRLVIVMGSDPSDFFSAVDMSLGAIAASDSTKAHSKLLNDLFVMLTRVKGESDRIGDLATNTAAAIPSSK